MMSPDDFRPAPLQMNHSSHLTENPLTVTWNLWKRAPTNENNGWDKKDSDDDIFHWNKTFGLQGRVSS
jgi:hypothetical protein